MLFDVVAYAETFSAFPLHPLVSVAGCAATLVRKHHCPRLKYPHPDFNMQRT
jgi:hypothetical protein